MFHLVFRQFRLLSLIKAVRRFQLVCRYLMLISQSCQINFWSILIRLKIGWQPIGGRMLGHLLDINLIIRENGALVQILAFAKIIVLANC